MPDIFDHHAGHTYGIANISSLQAQQFA